MAIDPQVGPRRTGRVFKQAALLCAVMLAAPSWAFAGGASAAGSHRTVDAVGVPGPCSCLRPGDSLHRNQSVQSPDGRFVLWLQGDGNLVEYAVGGNVLVPLWERGSESGWVLWMQNDGNAVLYRHDETPIWSSHTAGHPHDVMFLQSDADLVMYTSTGTPVFHNSARAPLFYDLRNVGSKECVFSGAGPHTPIIQAVCDPRSGNESFTMLSLGHDRYMLRTIPLHAECIDVPGNVATPVPLQDHDCVRSVGETFHWTPLGSAGRGTLMTDTTQTSPFNCVGVVGSSTTDGAAVGQAPCNGDSSQQWDLIPWREPTS